MHAFVAQGGAQRHARLRSQFEAVEVVTLACTRSMLILAFVLFALLSHLHRLGKFLRVVEIQTPSVHNFGDIGRVVEQIFRKKKVESTVDKGSFYRGVRVVFFEARVKGVIHHFLRQGTIAAVRKSCRWCRSKS